MPSAATKAELPGSAHSISWDGGGAEIWPLSAAIHRLSLRLADGRVVAPLAEAPWHDDRATTGDASIPAHLRWLGGEWPCVPFGRTEADPVVHGHGTDNVWRLVRSEADAGEWQIDYPAGHAIERVSRAVRGVPGRSAVAFTLSVLPRRDCMLPVGLHPIVALPLPDEDLVVEGAFAHGETFPVVFEKGVSRLAAGRRFDRLDSLPLAAAGSESIAALCRHTTEEAFQIFGVDGRLRLVYTRQRYALRLDWNAADFPSCLFWLSAGGRQQKPWRGRFRGLGVEPLAARFEDRGGEGAIAGGHAFCAGESWTTSYTLSAESLEEGR